MRVNLAHAVRQPGNQPGQPARGHGTRPCQAEHLVGRSQPGTPQPHRQHARERGDGQVLPWPRPRLEVPQYAQRLARATHERDGMARRLPHDFAGNDGVQLEVPVRIDVVERQAGRPEGGELRRNLARGLPPGGRAEEYARALLRRAGTEAAVGADEVCHHRRRERRCPLEQVDVQPNAQAGETARALHGVGRGGPRNHQAGRRQDARAVRVLDRLVHFVREAEIVGGNDQLPRTHPHAAFAPALARRSRRNWKNSTPSRSRRRSMAGLFTISPTIAAILLRRK